MKKYVGKECNHLDSKAGIEEYIREVGKFTMQNVITVPVFVACLFLGLVIDIY